MGIWGKHKKNIKQNGDETPPQTNKILFVLKLTTFSGNSNESLYEFLQQLESATASLTQQQKLEILLLRLNGNAANKLLQHMTENPNATWTTTVQLLKNLFPEPQLAILQQLKARIQQQEENISTFASDIKKLVNKAYPNGRGYSQHTREKQMISYFVNGTTSTIRNRLITINFTSFDEAVKTALQISNNRIQPRQQHELQKYNSNENEPSKEILLAASSSNEARRAPAKYFEYATLPPLNNFPSPPSQSRNRPQPLELPQITQNQEEEYHPRIIELDEYDELLRSTTPYPYFYKSYKKHNTIPSHLAPNARGNFVDQPYVDELTRLSPFESSYENRNIPSVNPRSRLTTTPEATTVTPEVFSEVTTEFVPVFETSTTFKGFPHDKSPFDYPEIRRAPIPRRTTYDEYKEIDNLQKHQAYMEKIALDSILNTKTAEVQSQTINIESKESNQVDKTDGEGIKSYKPLNNKEMKIEKAEEVLVKDNEKPADDTEYQNEQEIIENQDNQDVETLVPMNAVDEESNSFETNMTDTINEEIPTTAEPSTTSRRTHPAISSTTTAAERIEEYYAPEYQDAEPEPSTYDPRAFYHTLPPRPIIKKERYLTFCTKDLAIRDTNNMIVACGSDNEVWIPKRCPDGTDCFYTTDSTFRICCPVAEG